MTEVERAYLQGQFWRQLFSIFAMAAGNFYARGAGASCTSEVGLTLEDGSWDASFSTRSPFPPAPHTFTPRGSTHHVYSTRDMIGVSQKFDRMMEVNSSQRSSIEKGTICHLRFDRLSKNRQFEGASEKFKGEP